MSVVAPEAAAACHAAGVGATVTLDIGHKLAPRWGLPRSFKGTVKRLTDGQFTYRGGQWHGDLASMGPTAVFRIGSIDVILTITSGQQYSPTFDQLGDDWGVPILSMVMYYLLRTIVQSFSEDDEMAQGNRFWGV